MIISRQQFKL